MTNRIHDRYEAARQRLQAVDQDHVLQWWPELSTKQQETLLAEIESVSWEAVKPLIRTHVLAKPAVALPQSLSPAEVMPRTPDASRRDLYAAAVDDGRRLLQEGRVAALTVAGGQGTRLGYDGPKGAVIVTPLGELTLFALFADMVRAARTRYGVAVPWYIMTSPANHEETLSYFRSHHYFGLPEADVRMFSQGMLPAFSREGKALMAEKDAIALAPDGHGGTLKALVASGALADMQRRGVEVISYFQVDNPLVKPFDPLFLGLHARTASEMSTKVCGKADDLEKVGNVCMADGRLMMVEYSDFPEEYARAKNADGTRKFNAGNLAIHALSTSFVDRIISKTFALPYRRAEKVVAYVDDAGQVHRPDAPNAVKLETFIFDALPLAANPLVLEVDRAEEFSPVKNASGVDSIATSQRDQNLRACRWLEAVGVAVPKQADGSPDATVVITPGFALDLDDLRARRAEIPTLKPGARLLLE
jgi:UDP-N-acetylglucosamine/UDP-N-acetylgalactosamine diphosphorylase